MEFKHKSVLLDETINGLRVKPDGIYVDGTLGGAGHATEVCKKLSAKGRFIGIDQDQDAIIAASERLAPYKQATIIRSNYCYMVLAEYILEGKDISSNEKIEKHAAWVAEFLPKYDNLDKDNIQDVLRKEVGNVFVHVLEDAGVYKCTAEGREAFMRFINKL